MIANIGNLFGPDILVVFLIVLALPVVGIVLLVRYLAKKAGTSGNQQTFGSTSERLQRLESLKEQNLITPAEYQKQRESIISQL